MKLEDVKPEDRVFALFKGDPKTGKSIAAHSFFFGEPVYTFDLDARMESVKDYYQRVVGKLPNVTFDRFSTFFEIHAKLEELRANCPYKLIIMDSITSLAMKSLDTMIETRTPTEKSKTKDRGGIILTVVEDFGGEASALRMAMNMLLAISIAHNVSVIVTAHVIDPQPGAYRPMRVLLTGGKKIAAEIPIHFNEAYHFFVETKGGLQVGVDDIERKFVAVTRSIGTDWASTALDIPDKIDFTNGLLHAKIIEILKREKVKL
jgi:hypothetical protein